ncbi:hypothetical protein BD779DRAFT_946233 [Infundibulicybe gibba]|nr:hypothetical protein BD779DRAFT_946233 [Infundibulicybe gibba]
MPLRSSTAPSETSTRLSRRSVTTSSASTNSKPRTLSNASLINSNGSTPARSPNATPMPLPSSAAKRLSTAIPSLAARRASAPLQRVNSAKSVSTDGFPGTPSPTTRVSREGGATKPKPVPSVSGSARSTSYSMTRSNTAPHIETEARARVISMTPPRTQPLPGSTTPMKSPPVSSGAVVSPSINFTSPSPRNKNANGRKLLYQLNASPQQNTPPRMRHESTQGTPSSKHSTPPSGAEPRPQKSRNGSGISALAGYGEENHQQAPALLSESAAMAKLHAGRLVNGDSDDIGGGPFSVWDGDDMTLEMVTDINDGDVDEEMDTALSNILAMHTRKILLYKRLLERAQASASAQLHALQAEVRVLREHGQPTHERIPSRTRAHDVYVGEGGVVAIGAGIGGL